MEKYATKQQTEDPADKAGTNRRNRGSAIGEGKWEWELRPVPRKAYLTFDSLSHKQTKGNKQKQTNTRPANVETWKLFKYSANTACNHMCVKCR